MGREEHDRAANRFIKAMNLYATGLALKRTQLLRADPDLDAHELKQRLTAWLRTRSSNVR